MIQTEFKISQGCSIFSPHSHGVVLAFSVKAEWDGWGWKRDCWWRPSCLHSRDLPLPTDFCHVLYENSFVQHWTVLFLKLQSGKQKLPANSGEAESQLGLRSLWFCPPLGAALSGAPGDHSWPCLSPGHDPLERSHGICMRLLSDLWCFLCESRGLDWLT